MSGDERISGESIEEIDPAAVPALSAAETDGSLAEGLAAGDPGVDAVVAEVSVPDLSAAGGGPSLELPDADAATNATADAASAAADAPSAVDGAGADLAVELDPELSPELELSLEPAPELEIDPDFASGAGGAAASAVETDSILVTDGGEFFTTNYDATEVPVVAVVEKRRTPILGLAAFGAAVLIGVIVAIAVSVAVGDQYELALGLAIVAIVGSILSFLVGAAAAILRQGRWWGVAAMVLSVLVNPLSLIQILDLFSWS